VLETPHVAVGAAIAMKIGNPALSLPLSFLSHLLLEKVPHWNPHLNTEKKQFGKVTQKSTLIVTADSLLALGMGSYIALQKMPNLGATAVVFAACFLSVLPDVVEAPYFFLNTNDNPYIQRWIKFQKSLQVDAPPFWGILTQLLVTAASLWWIFS